MRALLEAGATNLEAKLGAHVAGRGDQCWETDNQVRAQIRRSDGRAYHRESIARARRTMARRGWMPYARIMPSGRLPSGWRSSQGTTNKRIGWKVLGLKNPVTRGEKREAKAKQIEDTNEATPRRRVALDPDFVAMVSGIGKPIVQAPRAPSSRPAVPSSRRTSMTPDEAKAALAAFIRETEERGPP